METKENKATTNVSKKPAAKKSAGFKGIRNAFWVIVICIIIAIIIFLTVFGNPANFAGGDTANKSINMLGTIYKGGFVVPIIHGMFLTVVALVVERWLALRTAFGSMTLVKFTDGIRKAMATDDLAAAQALCDKQGGSVAAVVSAALQRYATEATDETKSKKDKMEAIKGAIDDATAVEMPTLQMNLPILGVLTTLGVLTGLLGTVLGMIKSFAALSAGGGADSSALSEGISEALVNTASGIATSAVAMIFYNFYTNRIDKMTYTLDEVGFIIVNSFAKSHK